MSTSPTGRFDAFLYSAIDEDHNGMPLTVLSAFARNDLDPWDEAESLLRLGPDRAIPKLAEFIRRLPPGPTPRLNDQAIAVRLIVLLACSRAPPLSAGARRGVDAPRASGQADATPTAAAEAKTGALHYLLFYLLFVAVLIGSQWLSPASEPEARADAPAAAVTAPAPAAAPALVAPSAPGRQ